MEITQVTANKGILPDPPKRSAASKSAARPEDADFTVQLSSKASLATSTPPLSDEARQAKVAAVREQLASGAYSISGKDVAAKILNLLKG